MRPILNFIKKAGLVHFGTGKRSYPMIWALCLAVAVLPYYLAARTNSQFSNEARAEINEMTGDSFVSNASGRLLTDPAAGRHLASVMSSPNRLSRFAQHDIESMLNQPSLKRREGDIEIWQYQGEFCVLDLYFPVSSGNEQNRRALFQEFRPRKTAWFARGDSAPPLLAKAEPITCLKEIAFRNGALQTQFAAR